MPLFQQGLGSKPSLGDLSAGVLVSEIARNFHRTLAEMVVTVAKSQSYKKVLLSGGCFQKCCFN